MSFTRRHLPHWVPENRIIFITWRLAGSIPKNANEHPNRRIKTDDTNRSSVLPSGPIWLQDPGIARIVMNAILYGETTRHLYDLYAWVIRPNHVHAILQPQVALPGIMQWLKGRTSRAANRTLDRTGSPFWQDESFDHWIRSAQELHYLTEYVENNPVTAGLVTSKKRWPWSSAYRITQIGLPQATCPSSCSTLA